MPFALTDRGLMGAPSLETLALEFDFSPGCVVRNSRLRARRFLPSPGHDPSPSLELLKLRHAYGVVRIDLAKDVRC